MNSIEQNNKDFLAWMGLKENIHNVGRTPAIKEGEIWWAAVGENVGVEINGKNDVFSRPVLVFKKLSRYGFMAIPLTSQKHKGDWYIPFRFKKKISIASLAQARTMSVSRLYRRMGTIPDTDLELVREGFRKLYLKKISPQLKSRGWCGYSRICHYFSKFILFCKEKIKK